MFTYWNLALQGKAPALSPAMADVGQCGFWRTKDGSVAIWHDPGDDSRAACFVMRRCSNGKRIKSASADLPEVRGFGFAVPVSYGDYMHHFQRGVWPGEIPGLGHNTGQLSYFQEWEENIREQCKDATRWLKSKGDISTQTDADTAANYRDSIGKLAKRGEALLKEERDPLDTQIKEIRQRWGKPIDAATDVIKTLRGAVGNFLAAESMREEARVAEINRKLAEERKALEDRDVVMAALEPPVEKVKPKKVGAGGQLGRKTGLRDVYKPKITDYSKVLAFFSEHPAVQETIQKLCALEARSKEKRKIPGLEYVTTKEAI